MQIAFQLRFNCVFVWNFCLVPKYPRSSKSNFWSNLLFVCFSCVSAGKHRVLTLCYPVSPVQQPAANYLLLLDRQKRRSSIDDGQKRCFCSVSLPKDILLDGVLIVGLSTCVRAELTGLRGCWTCGWCCPWQRGELCRQTIIQLLPLEARCDGSGRRAACSTHQLNLPTLPRAGMHTLRFMKSQESGYLRTPIQSRFLEQRCSHRALVDPWS